MTKAWRRVIIIGGSGFIGRQLTEQLRRDGVPVLPLSSSDVDLRIEGAGSRLAAILEPHDALVTCAALTPDRGRDASTLIANLSIAKETCEAVVAAHPATVVNVSSDAVYVDGIERVDERTCAEPSTLHGLMHVARERLLSTAAEASRIPLVHLRPCALYGPGDTHGSYGPNRFVRTALAEATISLFGHGEERRDHLFVRDLCRVIARCLQDGQTGTFNVAGGRSVTFMEIAQMVARLAPRPVEIKELPRAAGGAITHRSIDIAALRAAMPELQPTALEDGLLETIAAAAAAGA